MAPIPEAEESQDRQPTEENNHEIEDVETPNFVINASSDDSASDDDGDENNGYQLLPQGEINDNNSEEEEEEENAAASHDPVTRNSGDTTIEEVSCTESEVDSSVSQVNPGLIHQLRHQNFPHCPSKNVPSYMQVQ